MNSVVCLPSLCLCWVWDAQCEHALMHCLSSFLSAPGHCSFEAEFSKSQKHSSVPQLSARCCNCQGCARGIQHLLVWLGSARDLLFHAPASCHAKLAAADLPLCLNANFRHMFQIAAELHIISQHWQLPTLHMPAESYAQSQDRAGA